MSDWRSRVVKALDALDAEIAVARVRDKPTREARFWAGYIEGLGFGRELLLSTVDHDALAEGAMDQLDSLT